MISSMLHVGVGAAVLVEVEDRVVVEDRVEVLFGVVEDRVEVRVEVVEDRVEVPVEVVDEDEVPP